MPSLFTDESAERVSAATRWVEGQYAKNNYRQRKRRPGAGGTNADLLRVISYDGDADPGDVAQPVSQCVYDGLTLSVYPTIPQQADVFTEPFNGPFGNEALTWCDEPYIEEIPIWIAKTSPTDGPIHHQEELYGFREMGSYTPAGFDARPLYVVKPAGAGGTGGAAIYRATANSDFSGADSTYGATITHVIATGNAGVGNNITIQNLYNEAGSSGTELLIVEWFDDPTLKYLPFNVARTTKKLYQDGLDTTTPNQIRYPLTYDWSYFEDPSPGEAWDILALTTETVVVGITWNDGSGNILVHREDHTIIDSATLPDIPEPTDTCP